MISVVVNTCCLGKRAGAQASSSGNQYAKRAAYLRDTVLPRLKSSFDQVIVAGEFESGPGYEYAPCPSRYFNCRDVLAQRQAGFSLTRYDFILFQMDDHVVDEGFSQ